MGKPKYSNIIIIVITMSLLLAHFAQAQDQLNVTFRPCFNDPVKNLGSTDLKNGGGFEVSFSYRFIPRLAAYAGWGRNSFNPENSDNSVDHFQETGYRFGLLFIHPMSSESKFNILLSAGGVFNHIETENDDGDIIDDTGHGLGWEVEAALSIMLNKRWQIVPGFRYHALTRDITIGAVKESVDLNYVSLGVGVSWTLVGY